MSERRTDVDLSVIVPVCDRRSPVASLYAEYKAGLDALGQRYELIFVLDGPCDEFSDGLRKLLANGEVFTVVGLTKTFGESTAIMAGFEHASGHAIVTLPAYHQIEGAEVAKLVSALDTADLVVGRRWPRAGSAFERARRRLFHGLLAFVTHLQFHDLGCGARAFDRRVLEEIQLYGDQHRFLAVLADRQGFRIREIDVRQSPSDRFAGTYGPRTYTRGLLDIFTIFFLVRFTKRPLRFFGMVGAVTFAVGAIAVTILVIDRLFFGHGLTGRPALLLAALLVVLGLQLFAIGLLGELMIFTHARELKDYQIERVVQFLPGRPSASAPDEV
jgi:glycosyltransferase involved in cell wall biosynthesis